MRRFRPLAVLTLLLVLAAGAGAQEKKTGGATPFPFNPWKKAKKGDWVVYYEKRDWGRRADFPSVLITWRVGDVSGDDVTISRETTDVEGANDEKVSAKEAPTLGSWSRLSQDYTIHDVQVADAKYKAQGKEFKGSRIIYNATHVRTGNMGCVLVVSPEVKVWGVVAEDRIPPRGSPGTYHVEVVGYGNGDKTEWGKTATEAKKLLDQQGK